MEDNAHGKKGIEAWSTWPRRKMEKFYRGLKIVTGNPRVPLGDTAVLWPAGKGGRGSNRRQKGRSLQASQGLKLERFSMMYLFQFSIKSDHSRVRKLGRQHVVRKSHG